MTVVVVTDVVAEVAWLADTLVLLRAGRIVQQGSARELAETPADPFVAQFMTAQRSLDDALSGGGCCRRCYSTGRRGGGSRCGARCRSRNRRHARWSARVTSPCQYIARDTLRGIVYPYRAYPTAA